MEFRFIGVTEGYSDISVVHTGRYRESSAVNARGYRKEINTGIEKYRIISHTAALQQE